MNREPLDYQTPKTEQQKPTMKLRDLFATVIFWLFAGPLLFFLIIVGAYFWLAIRVRW